MLLGMINYYDLGINKQPLVINKQEKCLFELGFNLENKKYIKFKNDPVVFIHIFNILA